MSFPKQVAPALSAIVAVIGSSFIGAGFNDAGNPDNDALFRIIGTVLIIAGFVGMTYLTHLHYEINIWFMTGLVSLFVGIVINNVLDDSDAGDFLGYGLMAVGLAITWQTYERGKDAGKWD